MAPRVAEARATAEYAHAAVAAPPPRVLHVHVEDALAECADELHVVHALVAEMRRVVVEPEATVALHRLDRALRAGDVERDLGRMHLEAEVHVRLVECLEDGQPALCEIVEALLPVRLRRGRKGVDRVPHRGAAEAVDHGRRPTRGPGSRIEQRARRSGGRDHLLSGPPADPLRLAVAPHVRRQDGPVALVDRVAHRLPHQVVRDRKAGQAMRLEQRPLVAQVLRRGNGLVHVEVVAPARQLDTIVAHAPGEGSELRQGQIGPLAGEERDGAHSPDNMAGARGVVQPLPWSVRQITVTWRAAP